MAENSEWVLLSATTEPDPLEDEPRNFRVTAKTANTLTLGWDKSEDGSEVGYEIERLNGTEWQPIWQGVVLNFTDSGLTPVTEYSYRIRSKKA